MNCPTSEMYSEGVEQGAYVLGSRLGCFCCMLGSALVGVGIVWAIAGWIAR